MTRRHRLWHISVTAQGLNLERLLRQAGEAGIRLSGMNRLAYNRLQALIREEQLPMLTEIAHRGGWTLTIGRRKGIGHMAEWLRARMVLSAALIAAGIALILASQAVWRVEIIGAGSYAADIQTALTEMGIRLPALRLQVDIGALREALEWRYPRIAWIECGFRGSTLVIRAEEGVLPKAEPDRSGAWDVVAARDGVVQNIVTYAGTPVVKIGDVVRAGEVLICGEERTSDGAVKPVAAEGSVIARVWEGASVRMSVVETQTHYTGRTQTVWTVTTPWFDLWPMADSSFETYDTAVSQMAIGGIFMPMTLRTETRMEAEYTVQRRERTELEAEAYQAAVRKLHEKTGFRESFIDIWGNCSMIDDENLLSVAIGELHREIGRQVLASGMAASGQANPE